MPDIWMDVDAAVTVPCNLVPLVDATDGKTLEVAIAYNEAGMLLTWNFVTPAGVMSSTAFTPTMGGVHDWIESGTDRGMYKVEIPASGGTVNNDTEGFGWISGTTSSCLPFRGPTIGFRASALNDLLIESAYSATRGLAGTALPAAAADAAGGLPISDAGGLDLDAIPADVAAVHVHAQTIETDVAATHVHASNADTKTASLTFTVANQVDANVLTQANIDFGALQKASLNAATPASLQSIANIWTRHTPVTGIDLELVIDRIYEILNNHMHVTEATGVVTLYAADDITSIATGAVNSAAGTTDRDQFAWV